MRDFSKVSPQLWMNRQFKSLSDEAKLAMIYFLTCRHQCSAGCYQLPDGYGSSDLGWTTEKYIAARQEVAKSGLVLFDEGTSDLYIVGWFLENPVTNDNHHMGCERIISMIDSETISEAAGQEMEESMQRYLTKSAKKKAAQSQNGYEGR